LPTPNQDQAFIQSSPIAIMITTDSEDENPFRKPAIPDKSYKDVSHFVLSPVSQEDLGICQQSIERKELEWARQP